MTIKNKYINMLLIFRYLALLDGILKPGLNCDLGGGVPGGLADWQAGGHGAAGRGAGHAGEGVLARGWK